MKKIDTKVDLKEAIEASKIILQGTNSSSEITYTDYSKVYFNSNECIEGYLRQVSFDKGSALSVLASGDHAFNLSYYGVKNIDVFDINKLTYFIFNIRKALLLAMKRADFIEANKHFLDASYALTLIQKLKSFMPQDVYEYFKEMLFYAFKTKQVTRFHNLIWSFDAISACINNDYLKSDEAYNRTKRNLEETTINYYFGNALSLAETLDKKYHIILLSNIMDYLKEYQPGFSISDLEAFFNSYRHLLENNGVIINYLFHPHKITGDFTKEELINIGGEINFLEGGSGYCLVRK